MGVASPDPLPPGNLNHCHTTDLVLCGISTYRIANLWKGLRITRYCIHRLDD